MKKKLKEASILILSVFKWSLLGVIVGSLTGISVTFFIKTLDWFIKLISNIDFYYLFLPLILFITGYFTKLISPDYEGIGTDKVIEAIHKRFGKIKITSIPLNFIMPILTIGFGGSAGKEAPSCDIGTGISSFLSDIFRFKDIDRKKLAICGISAGFSSVFGTPIAGAIFGLEVLYVGNMFYEALLPSFISGLISYHISSSLGISYFYKPIDFYPVFTNLFLLKII